MIHQIGPSTISGNGYQAREPNKTIERQQSVSEKDKISLSYSSVTYSEYNVEGRITTNADSRYYHLQTIVSSMLSEQGMTIDDAINGKPYIVDEATKEEASSLIAENGYWGVEQTSERIFQFAVNASGNDSSKIEEIRAAIEKGFNMALESFGGTLPEISYQTYDAVSEKLDNWAGETNNEDSVSDKTIEE